MTNPQYVILGNRRLSLYKNAEQNEIYLVIEVLDGAGAVTSSVTLEADETRLAISTLMVLGGFEPDTE